MLLNTPGPPAKSQAVSYDPMASIAEWHKAVGQKPFIEEDAHGRRKMAHLRLRLIGEEYEEVANELLDVMNKQGDRVKLAKELADLLYVVYGTADVFEIDLPKVFAAVHESNMTKVGSDGKVQRRPDGKILKGSHYEEPDIASIVLPAIAND